MRAGVVEVIGERPSFLNDITVSNDEDEEMDLYATEHYSSRIERWEKGTFDSNTNSATPSP